MCFRAPEPRITPGWLIKSAVYVTLHKIREKMTEKIVDAYNIDDLEKQGYKIDEKEKDKCRQCEERLDCLTGCTMKQFGVPGVKKAYCMSYSPDWEKISEMEDEEK